jgi:hypothetical protein
MEGSGCGLAEILFIHLLCGTEENSGKINWEGISGAPAEP